MILDPEYWLWTGELDKGLCDLIIDCGNSQKLEDGIAGGEVNEDVRRSKIGWVPPIHWISAITNMYGKLANEQAWQFDATGQDGIQFTRYGIGEHYKPHMDTHSLSDDMRKISLVIQLNKPEDYEGGEFNFINEDGEGETVEGFKEQGSILVFPSFRLHQVTPVTSGTRHSIVTWFIGPQLK
jgi:PKHD-type hydroxylase